jgi:hypothetical protein
VSVVKFPGVIKTIHEMTPEEIEEQFNRVVPMLPRMTEEEAVARQEKMDEEFYYEDATEAITHSFILLSERRKQIIEEFGENSAEVTAVKKEIAPVVSKLRELENNLSDPVAKNAIKSLRNIWGEYRGGYYDEQGEYQWRKKSVGAEIVPALRAAIDFNL